MPKKVPFYSNYADNQRCTVATFRMVFEYFFEKTFSFEEMEKIGHYIPGRGSWTIPFHIYLAKNGVEVHNVEPFEYEIFQKDGTEYLKKIFKPEVLDYYINQSNLFEVKDQIPEFLSLIKRECRKGTIDDVKNFLKNDYLVVAEVNSRVLNDQEGFMSHIVLVVGMDEEGNFLINDPGPTNAGANRKISPEIFSKALGEDGSNGEITGVKKKNL